MRRSFGAATTCVSVALALISYFTPSALAQNARAARPSRSGSGASQSQTQQPVSDRVRREIEQLRARPEGSRLPPADSFTVGPRAVPLAATQSGAVAVADGSLDVYGRLEGNAYALNGDIVVHSGGVVTGDAVSIGGRVLIDGGRVDGERLALSAPPTGVAPAARGDAPLSAWQSIKLVVGWFAVLVIIGLGVLVFAEANMDGVVDATEANFAKAFWFGVLGQIVALPVLTLLCIGLVLTLIGILLVPFAVVAYCIAFAGLLAMGFLAVARLTGGIWSRSEATTASAARGANIRALFIGLVLYMGLWLLAAAFTWQPIAGAILRAIALTVSWVAVTLGLGATLLSRAGTKRLDARQRAAGGARRPAPTDLAWQTPTPVTGVTAARRPVVATKDAT
jgi:hypothetical protein